MPVHRNESTEQSKKKQVDKSKHRRKHSDSNTQLPLDYQIRHEINEATDTDSLEKHTRKRSSRPKSKPSDTSTKAQQFTFLTPEYQQRHVDDVPGNTVEHHDVATQKSQKRKTSGKKKGNDTGRDKSSSPARRTEPHKDNSRQASKPNSASSGKQQRVESRGSSTGSRPHWWNHKIRPHKYTEQAPHPTEVTNTPPPKHVARDRHTAPVDNSTSPIRTPPRRVSDDHTPHRKHRAVSPDIFIRGLAPPYVLVEPSKDKHSTHSRVSAASRKSKTHTDKKRHKLKNKTSSTRSKPHFWNRNVTGHVKTARDVTSPPKQSTPVHQVASTHPVPLTCEPTAPVKPQQSKPTLKHLDNNRSTSVSPAKHVDLSHTRRAPVQNKPPPKVQQPCSERQRTPARPSTVPPPRSKPDQSPPFYLESHLRPRGFSPAPYTLIDTRLRTVTSRVKVTTSREVPKVPAHKDFDRSRPHTSDGVNKANVHNRLLPQSARYHDDEKREELRQSRNHVSVPPKRHYDKHQSEPQRPRSVSSETIRPRQKASPQRQYNYEDLPRDNHETSPPVSTKRTCQNTSQVFRGSSSSSRDIPRRDISTNRAASFGKAHQISHDKADRKVEERRDTSRSPRRHISSVSQVTSTSSRSSVVDSGQRCSSISRTSSHSGRYNVQSSRSSDREKREGGRSPTRHSPVRNKSSDSSLDKSGRYNVNDNNSSQGDRYDFNGSNNKTSDYRTSTAEPPAKMCLRSKYQVKKTRSKISYKISHQTFPESNGRFSPLANSTSIASSTTTYSNDKPHQNTPPVCNCRDENTISPTIPQLQSTSSVFSDPSNVSSVDHSNSSTAAMKAAASHRAPRPSLHTYHKMSHSRAAPTKTRQNVSDKSKSKTDTKQSSKRCGDLKSCREMFPDYEASNRSVDKSAEHLYNSESEFDSQNTSLVLCSPEVDTTGCTCEDEDSSNLLDQVLNLVCRSHRLQELIKYQLDKIDAIDAAVAARADDLRRRPRDAALHPELYAVAKNTLKVKVQLLRELCEIKKDVTKLKNTMSLISKEDLTDSVNYTDEPEDFSATSIQVKTVNTSRSNGKSKRKMEKLNSSEVVTINKTVTFNRNVTCRCPTSREGTGQMMTSSGRGRGREDGEDAGDVALLKDIMGEVSTHVREFQSFVNQIDPSLNDIVSNVKALSHTFVTGSEGQSSCGCNTRDKEQRGTTSTGHKRASSPQKMYARAAAQGDKDMVSYWSRGQDRTERVWDKITSCVDAILQDGGAPFEPEATRHAQENESNAIMDDVYRMIEEMDSELSCCDADCTNKADREDDDEDEEGDCDCDEQSDVTNQEDVSNGRNDRYSTSNRNTTGANRNELDARRVPAARERAVSQPRKSTTLDERVNSLLNFAEELAASAQSISQCACGGDASVASVASLAARNATQAKRLKPPTEQNNLDTLYQLAARNHALNEAEAERSKITIKTQSKRSITLKVLVPRRSANKLVSASPQKIDKNRDGDLHSSPVKPTTRDHEFVSCDSLIVKTSEEKSKFSNKTDDFCSCQSDDTSQSQNNPEDFSSTVGVRQHDNSTARQTALTSPGHPMSVRGHDNSTARQTAVTSPGQPMSVREHDNSTARQTAVTPTREGLNTRGRHVEQDISPYDTCECSGSSDTIVYASTIDRHTGDDWNNHVARRNDVDVRQTTPQTKQVARRNDVAVRQTTPMPTNHVARRNDVEIIKTTPTTPNHVARRNDVEIIKTTQPTKQVARRNDVAVRQTTPPTKQVARRNDVYEKQKTPPTNQVARRNDVYEKQKTPPTNQVARRNDVAVRQTTPPTKQVTRRNDVYERQTTPTKTEVYILRRIEPDCLLVEWTVSSKDCYSGFDVYVDDVLAQRVRSPQRFQAILHGLDLGSDHVVTLVALCVRGGGNEHCTTQARVAYKGGQRPYRCTRYGGSIAAS